jgi:hypothetical protein
LKFKELKTKKEKYLFRVKFLLDLKKGKKSKEKSLKRIKRIK